MPNPLSFTLIIANPHTHSGKRRSRCKFARHFLTGCSSCDPADMSSNSLQLQENVSRLRKLQFDCCTGDGVIMRWSTAYDLIAESLNQRFGMFLWVGAVSQRWHEDQRSRRCFCNWFAASATARGGAHQQRHFMETMSFYRLDAAIADTTNAAQTTLQLKVKRSS